MVAGVEAAVEDLNTVKRGEGEDIVELKASVGIYQGGHFGDAFYGISAFCIT